MLRLVITDVDLRFLRDVSFRCPHFIAEDVSGAYHTPMVTYWPLMRALQCGRSPVLLKALPRYRFVLRCNVQVYAMLIQ